VSRFAAPSYPRLTATLPPLPNGLATALEAIPGVKLKGARVTASWHAVPVLDGLLRHVGVTADGVEWVQPPAAEAPWDRVRAALEGTAKPFVLDGFLTDYQRDALCFSVNRPGTMLHHPTGSGKTVSAILWAAAHPHAPTVIVTRATTRGQFAREVARFTRYEAFPVKPTAEVRKRDRWQGVADYVAWCRDNDQPPWLVVGWENVADHVDALLALGVQNLVLDESHKGKSDKRWEVLPLAEDDAAAIASIKARGGFVKPAQNGEGIVGILPRENTVTAVATLAKAASRRLATTATPVSDRIRDLWGQLDLLEPGAWGPFGVWARRYADAKPGQYGGLDTSGISNPEELVGRLAYVLHRVDHATTHAQLPKKRRESMYIAPVEQCDAAPGFTREQKAAAANGASAVLELKLAEAASKKRKAVLNRIAEHVDSGHKIVVFTGRRRDCDDLATSIRGACRKATVWSAHGGHSQQERQDIKDEYRAHSGGCVLVGTGEAWGTAVDGLQCTDAAFFVMLPYTPGQLTQWEGRFTRLGQDRPVVIYYCIAEGTVDEHVTSILLTKIANAEQVADGGSLDGASEALAGLDDPDAIMASILSKIGSG
jgi:hypothetical protein